MCRRGEAMTDQPTYPQTYQYRVLKKAMLAMMYLAFCGLGLAAVALIRGMIPAPDRFGALAEMSAVFALAISAIYVCITPQVRLWLRVVFSLTALGLLVAFFYPNPDLDHLPRNFWVIEAAGPLLIGVNLYFLTRALRGKLVLYADRLDFRSAFFSRRVVYADVVDSYIPDLRSDQNLIVLKLRDGTSLAVGTFGHWDAVIDGWIGDLPDEKEAARRRQWDDLVANPVFPRVYQQGAVAKTIVSLLSLGLCGVGVACLAVSRGLFPELQSLCDWAAISLLIMIVFIWIEPRYGSASKAILSLACFGVFLAGINVYNTHLAKAPLTQYDQWVEPAIGSLFLGLGLFWLIAALRTRLVLYDERIEYRGFLTTRTVHDADIVQTFEYESSFHSIGLKLKSGKSVRIVNFGDYDAAFNAWITTFPNREREEKGRQLQRRVANPAFGGNEAESVRTYNTDFNRLKWLEWPIKLIAIWGMVYPFPYQICMAILMTLPVLAFVMVIASRKKWSMHFNDMQNIGVGELVALGPAAILGLRGFVDNHTIDWITPLEWGAAVGLGLMAFVFAIERRFTWSTMASVSVIYFCYAWGSLLYVNGQFSPDEHEAVAVTVLAVDNDSKMPQLTVTRWGDRHDGNQVRVGHRLAANVHKGDTVCVYIYPGALGWTFYDVGRCPSTAHPSRP